MAGGASPVTVALTIAGSDSGGGAGIQGDLKAFAARDVHGASVITALTAQNTLGVSGIHDIPASFVRAQIDAVFSDFAIAATKTGMLANGDVIAAVVAGLKHWGARQVVVDPVMISTSGARLLQEDAVEALKHLLLPLADLATPNLLEAAALLGEPVAADERTMTRQGEALLRLGARAVLVKGGHGGGAESADILVDGAGATRFAAPRITTKNTHGTGCALSAAIAAELGKGVDLRMAVWTAKAYLTDALAAGAALTFGAGSGPIDHFHAFRRGG